jgi:hypothetical protein
VFLKLKTRQPRYFSHKNYVGWITEVPLSGRHVYLGHHVGGLLLCMLKDPLRAAKRPEGETQWRFVTCVMESDGRMIQKCELGSSDIWKEVAIAFSNVLQGHFLDVQKTTIHVISECRLDDLELHAGCSGCESRLLTTQP